MRSVRVLQNFSMLLILPCLASATWGQTDIEVNAGVQFNFSTPGARSLAMGSTFLGLADDATAAYTNPAGLTTLTRPEVSFEGRGWSYSNVFTDRVQLSGETFAGLRDGETTSNVTGPSFVSLVCPISHWRWALYRHELANFEVGFTTSDTPLLTPSGTPLLSKATNSLDLKIVNLGISFAVEVNEAVSFGFGLSSYDFYLNSRADRGDFRNAQKLSRTQTQTGTDQAVGFNGGFRWRIRDIWTLGAAYRQGPSFDVDATDGEAGGPIEVTKRARFHTPDFLGLGLAVQPAETVTVNLEFDRIFYSSLTKDFTSIVKNTENRYLTPAELRLFRANDAMEIHLGIEKVFHLPHGEFLARAGAWRDPDHRIWYGGSDLKSRALFRPGKDYVHYSAGIGFSGDRLAVDGAVDLSGRGNIFSLSTVYRF